MGVGGGGSVGWGVNADPITYNPKHSASKLFNGLQLTVESRTSK